MSDVQQVLPQLTHLLSNFQGREYSEPIVEETLFFADLGFASIDAVVLGEALEDHFQQSFPFQQFLAQLNARQARDIAVGDLARFIAQHLP